MGMHVTVYRSARSDYDCTNGGASSYAKQLCLTNVDGPWEPTDEIPAAKLVARDIGGVVLSIVPDAVADKWHTFGGNYAATSDSRFSEACRKMSGHAWYGAVPIHDRVE